jgi:hypothetical protein
MRKKARTDRQTDRVALPNFTNTHKINFYSVLQRVSWRPGFRNHCSEMFVLLQEHAGKYYLFRYCSFPKQIITVKTLVTYQKA